MKKLLILSLGSLMFLLCLPPLSFATDINLFVAASLKEVVNELADNYAGKHAGISFRKNYGASGALAKQIENGAPADIFISANTDWMDFLKTRKLVDEKSVDTFTYNVLVFAGKAALKVTSLQEVVRLERIAIGSPKSVPAGEYALAALKKAGLDKQLEKKLVMAKDVRECLMYADRGEVDGAFVYKTDVQQAARSAGILFIVPQEYSPQVTYPMALTSVGARSGEAAAFYASLRNAEAKAILKKHGFIVKLGVPVPEFTSAEYAAIFLSLKVAVVATLLSLPFGFAVAYLLTYRQFRGKVIVDVLVNLPLTLPPVVIGYFLLVVLGQKSLVSQHLLQPLGIKLIFTWKAAVIATAVVGFPLLVRAIRIGMETIDPGLIQASRALGAGWLDSLLTIILPLSLRGVLAGSALMFARGLGEFGATIIVAGNIPGVTQTIPLAIYDYASSPSGDTMAMALCAVSVIISVLVLLLHEVLGSKLGKRD